MHVSELETPAVVIDLDKVERNLNEMAAYCASHGLALRPHTKTHKMPEIARMQLSLGAQGITVAKLGEAEVMARAGIDDILIAFPIVGTAKLNRLVDLARSARVTVSTDSADVARAISDAAAAGGVRIGLLAEMDAGLRRCGVQSPGELAELSLVMAGLPNVEFLGFLFFPGHIRLHPDKQAAALTEIDQRLQEAQDRLFRSGVQAKTVSGGSTPTALRSHLMKTVTEIRPGTYVFNDMNTVTIGATDLAHCAVTVHATVVSVAVKGRAIMDAGSKTLSSDLLRGGEGRGFGYSPEQPEIMIESMSEEHGHLNVGASPRTLKVGDRLRFIPNHVCTTINLHDQVWMARGEEIVDRREVSGRGRVR